MKMKWDVEKWETHKQLDNTEDNDVEEGHGENKENEEGFSWLGGEVQEEQQHQLTCICRSKPATQAPATESS